MLYIKEYQFKGLQFLIRKQGPENIFKILEEKTTNPGHYMQQRYTYN